MLKCPCSAFVLNYVQHINDIHDTFYDILNIKESKKYNVHQFHGQPPQNRIAKSKNYDLDPCNNV